MSLAEGPPSLPYPKLPFWDTVSLAYSTYFRYFIEALRTSWLWLIVTAALTGITSWQQWSWIAAAMPHLKAGEPPRMSEPPWETMIQVHLASLFVLLAGVSIAVAWHRLMILNEHPGFSGSNLVTNSLWRYIATGLKLTLTIALIMFLPIAAVMIPTSTFLTPVKAGPGHLPLELFPVAIVTFVVYAAAVAITMRLSLMLPAQAIGDTMLTYRQVWNRSRGNTWRLFWGFCLTTIPPWLIWEIASLLVIRHPDLGTAGVDDFVVGMVAASTIGSVYYLLILPIGIGFVSHAYRYFFRGGLEIAD